MIHELPGSLACWESVWVALLATCPASDFGRHERGRTSCPGWRIVGGFPDADVGPDVSGSKVNIFAVFGLTNFLPRGKNSIPS